MSEIWKLSQAFDVSGRCSCALFSFALSCKEVLIDLANGENRWGVRDVSD